ncbi:MAG: S41 family peptidase [Ramlibacter sp.]
MKRFYQVVALLAALLAGCGGGGGGTATPTTAAPPVETSQAPAAPASCSLADQKTWLSASMRDRYFWYDRMGTANAAAPNIDSYFASLLYSPVDRYSYTQPAATFTQFYAEGTRLGYGYSLVFTDSLSTTMRVRAVEPASPVALAGIRRGDFVLSIDGRTPSQLAAEGLAAVSTEGVPRTFVLRDRAGAQRTITVSSAVFALAPVLAQSVLDVATPSGSRKVAYMAYQEFISAGNTAMGEAFSRFASQGATELVLDLRYNGGGEVGIARNLSSMIGGSRLAGQTFTQLRFNGKHPEDNLTIPFTADGRVLPGPPLQGLRRVFVIASSGTASASELVINSLKPFMEVVLVGGTTYGKPYGFEPVQACGTVFNAVNFESVNALGVGGYNNGISPTCVVPDDLDHALGDPAEGRIAAALYFAGNGVCPATASALAQDAGAGKLIPAITEGGPPGMWRR